MTPPPALSLHELELLRRVFRAHPSIQEVRLFGSRAKGTHTAHSDVDLALFGDVTALHAERIAAELDELPTPYHYDVKSFAEITFEALRDHIARVGVPIYPGQVERRHAKRLRIPDEENPTASSG